MKSIYLDHNATTPMRPQARAALWEALELCHGNPSSLHGSGRAARQLLDQSRERVAAALCVHEDELVFTSGGTEANNLALLGALRAAGTGAELVTTTVEHPSVLGPARQLQLEGHTVEFVEVQDNGIVDPHKLLERVRPRCRLVSVMTANNEIGSLMPLREIAAGLKDRREPIWLHTDAVQALGRCALRLRDDGIDLASFSAHKCGGPLGVGVLWRRAGIRLQPALFGGEHEHGLRPGTENVPAIVAAAVAIELAVREQVELAARLSNAAAGLWRELTTHLSDLRLLGPSIDDARRLPGTLNILSPHDEGKVLVMRLDLAGVECSAGSACASGSLEPSHVLLALGLDERAARAGLRLSIGRTNTPEELAQLVDILRRTLGATSASR